MGAELTDFTGSELRGSLIVLRVNKHHPPRRNDHYREVEVPLAVLRQAIDGTHPALEALNGGDPLPFEIHVKVNTGDGAPTYDVVFGKRPGPGEWPHDDIVEPEGDPE